MIFLSAQPDDTYFIWQLQVLTNNLKELEVDRESIHILVGYKKEINPLWVEHIDTVYGNVHFIKDERVSSTYLSSIRPHIIKKFMMANSKYLDEYIFYHDADILFGEIPLFEGMEDGRVHVSRTSYIDYSYITSKNSPSLLKDMLNVVGIDETTVAERQNNTGGAQYYFKGLGYNFWDKVERDCEIMYKMYFNNLDTYKKEFASAGRSIDEYDFQIWTTDMWVVLWNIWLLGYKTYANNELDFAWPTTDKNEWIKKYKIFHNSGVSSKERFDFLYKQDFHNVFPYGQISHLHPQIKFDNGVVIDVTQQVYIEAINKTGDIIKGLNKLNKNVISCVLIVKIDNFDSIKESVDSFINQTYASKELIIFNINETNITLPESYKKRGIRFINITHSFVSNAPYVSLENARNDANSLAFGSKIIRWDNMSYLSDYLEKLHG